MAPIHQAARKNDVVALQRELDAGVSPDLYENDFSGTYRPLADVIVFGTPFVPRKLFTDDSPASRRSLRPELPWASLLIAG